MRTRLLALLAGLALTGSATAAGGPLGFTIGGSASLSLYIAPYHGGPGGPGGMPVQLGPWYQYWPLEAHFVNPAPMGYPFWPSPQTLPDGSGSVLPGAGYGFAQPAGFMPQAPYYWGGR